MKFNTIKPSRLQPYFEQELRVYRAALEKDQFSIAWRHLERAHIIGQSCPWEHSYLHWKMLLFGIRIKSTKEVIGQIPRLLVGGVKSFVGKIPVGNTGGAKVPPLKSMEIPPDIQQLINSVK